MATYNRQSGSVLVMVVFVIALLSTIVMGILELNTVDIQIMQNHVSAVEALMTAQAGLNDALAQLRLDAAWTDGFTGKAFNGGTYTVALSGGEITSTGTSAQGFSAKVVADVTLSASGPPYTTRLDTLKVNDG